MPVTYSAKKALRRDQRRAKTNLEIKRRYKEALKRAKKLGSKKALQEAGSLIDRAAKKRVIHKNKAARLKSRLAKLLQRPKEKTVRKKMAARKKKKRTKKKAK